MVSTSGRLPAMVRPGLVLAGLSRSIPARLAMGISAMATDELKGPTTPTTAGLVVSAIMFCAPSAGSCSPLATEASFLGM